MSEPKPSRPFRMIFHVELDLEQVSVTGRSDGTRTDRNGCRKVMTEGMRSGNEKIAMNAER